MKNTLTLRKAPQIPVFVLAVSLSLTAALQAAKPPSDSSGLAAPGQLTATLLAPDEAGLAWVDNSTTEQQFIIERSTDNFKTLVKFTVGANVTQYTDTGLLLSTTYAYRVRASNKKTISSPSNVATVTTPDSGVVIGAWVPIFQGVEHATGLTAVATSPRQVVNALRVDLTATGISFYSTAPSPNYQPNVEETTGMTTSHWLLSNNLQAAINGNWFSPCCTTVDGSPEEVIGLAISNYDVVSAQESADYSATMLVTAVNHATILPQNWPANVPSDVLTAVAGKNSVLVGGSYVGTNTSIAPRTAAGLTADNHLILMTIDGRQPGYSDGAADSDTAAWMTRFGATDAFNLDGGGSTTMAVSDGSGGAVLLNQPINGSPGIERAVANHFGVRALPLNTSSSVRLATVARPKLDPAGDRLVQLIADGLVDTRASLTVTSERGGLRRIQVHGAPDYTYELQFRDGRGASPWQTLARGAADEAGILEVVDQAARPSRQYRVVRP